MNKELKEKLIEAIRNCTDRYGDNRNEIEFAISLFDQNTLTLESKIEQLTKERDELKEERNEILKHFDSDNYHEIKQIILKQEP